MTQRWKITIEYDGTDYAGWQRQENALGIQAVIEDAIAKFCGETATITASGRTDAGVHALGQVAHFDLEKETDAKAVRDAINFHMRPHPVSIVAAEPAAPAFNARFDCTKRVYCYRLLCARSALPALAGRHVWHVWRDLDIAAMNKAAKHLIGNHDFSTFRAAECQAKTPVRTLDRVEFIENKTNPTAGRHLELWVEGRSFLHHQVRNIVGTLALVGTGKWTPDDVKAALDAKDRTKGGPTAPPQGLYFVRAEYGTAEKKTTVQQAFDSLL